MAKGKHSADGGYIFDDKVERKYTSREEEEREEYLDNTLDYEEDDEPNYEKIRIVCGIVIGLIIIGIAAFVATKDFKGKTVENVVANTVETNTMESTYENYVVLGKIKIEKIGLEQYILDSKEEDAMKKGIVRLYGGSLNNYGNLCLAGHNFDNLFGKLNELDNGDTIKIIEKDFSETEYKVKEILTVEPDDLTVLMPKEDKVELTLITCENASTKRLVIKAEEKK